MRHTRAAVLGLTLALAPPGTGRTDAQPSNPVYVDDSPRAAEVLGQLPGLVERGSTAEAVRALQTLLETEAERLTPDPEDPQVYRGVRERAHEALLASPELLERYRLAAGPLAARLLAEGETERVEREMLLTEAGFDAALALAEARFVRADFDSARLMLLQLDAHPDRVGARAAQAAGLLAEIARFRASDDDLRLAQSWSDTVPGELEPVTPPDAAMVRGYAAFDPMSALSDREPLQRPLRSTPYGANESEPSLMTDAERPWILPTAAGRWLVVNDGDQAECFDTATLERRWVYAPAGERDPRTRGRRTRGRNQPVEDTMTATVGGGVAVFALGETFNNRRWGDGRLHAVELDTGRRLWSVGPSANDDELAGAMFHGPAVIAGDTVVVNLFTFSPLRRVHLAHIVGVDLYTGRTEWVQLVGTAGVMPSRRGLGSSPATRLHEGIAYVVSPMGVMTAVEAATGRVAWSRLVRSANEARGGDFRAWMQQAPVVDDGRLIAVEPDRERLVVLDAATGHELGARSVMDLGWPEYMVRVGELLVFVGPGSFRVTSVRGVLDEDPAEIPRVEDPRAGRGVVSGDLLIEPTQRGVQLVDPGAGVATHAKLEHPGAPAVAEGQLLAVGPMQVHGYLDWDSAQHVLRARIESDPEDPTPAIALAELAFRAGDTAAIAPAGMSALDASERSGDRAAGDRLFDALLEMLESGQLARDDERGAVVDVLERAARSPSQRVGVSMQRGLWHRDAGRGRDAAGSFQSILDDPGLASSQYQTRWRLERADRAATAALATLIEGEGAGVYLAYAQAADEQFEALNADPEANATSFEALARRYPVAPAAPLAWLRAAEGYTGSGDRRLAQSALRNGFDAASRLGADDEPTTHELAGRLTDALVANDKLYAALQVLRRAPTLTRDGAAIDAAALERELLARLGARSRPARVGATPGRMAQLLGGWEPVEPLSGRGPDAASHLILRSERRGVLALWTVGDEAGPDVGIDWESTVLADPDAPLGLVPVWTRPLGRIAANEPILVSLTPTTALLYDGVHDAARLESIDTVTGSTTWETPVFGSFFDERPERYDTGVLETPLDGQVWLRDHLIVVGGRHIGVVERFGRAVVFERETGTPVFAAQLDVPMIYEAALDDGVLAVVGERPGDPGRNEGDGVVPMAAAYDIATGEPVFGPAEFRDRRSFGRWVRLAGDRTMLLGLDLGVVGIDLTRGETVWTVDDPAVRLSGDCIVGRDRAYVVGLDRQLWQINLTTGLLRPQPLQDLGRVAKADTITTATTPEGGLVFASDVGLAIFDRAGRLVGGDAYDGLVPFSTPALAEGLAVAVARRPEPTSDKGDETQRYRFAAMRLPDGTIQAERSLELHGAPRSVHALDDFIVVGLDGSAAVYHAPAEDDASGEGSGGIGVR